NQGRLEEAGEQFRRVLRQHPDNARAYLGLGRLAFEREALAETISHLHRCVANAHTRKAAHNLLAQTYERLREKSPAEQELRQAALLPNDAAWPNPFYDEAAQLQVGKQAFLTRADELINQGRYAEALPLLQQTVQDYPDSALAWVLVARVYLGLKDL